MSGGSSASSVTSTVPSPFLGISIFWEWFARSCAGCFTPGFTTPRLQRLCSRPIMINGPMQRSSTCDGSSEHHPYQFLIHCSCGEGLGVGPGAGPRRAPQIEGRIVAFGRVGLVGGRVAVAIAEWVRDGDHGLRLVFRQEHVGFEREIRLSLSERDFQSDRH